MLEFIGIAYLVISYLFVLSHIHAVDEAPVRYAVALLLAPVTVVLFLYWVSQHDC